MHQIVSYLWLIVLCTLESIQIAESRGANRFCKFYEVYDECTSPCIDEPTCNVQNPTPKPGPCELICIGKCVCKNGLVRNLNTNRCIKPQFCPVCGKNEFFNTCASKCQPDATCEDQYPTPRPEPCTKDCDQRCQCRRGFVRNEDGICVRPSQCHTCGKNEFYNTCASRCKVEPTCNDQNPTPKPGPCTTDCVQRCECLSGFVRNEEGICVRPSQCNTCGENEFYNSCASRCLEEPTCNDQNPTPKPGPCTTDCVQRCECLSGFVRNEDGICVRPSQCNTCGENEFYNSCASRCLEEPTCNDQNPTPKPGPCTTDCVQRCECVSGFVRNENGICVRPSQCNNCGTNEFFNTCASICIPEATCIDQNPTPKPGPCPFICVQRCECLSGFVRNENGICVRPSQCNTCGENEFYNSCASRCLEEPTCNDQNPTPKPGPCTTDCVQRCECLSGFVRNEGGVCVNPSKCNACSTGEYYNTCASRCTVDPTCDNPNPTPKPGPCTTDCVQRCECLTNYVRDNNNICIPIFKCFK